MSAPSNKQEIWTKEWNEKGCNDNIGSKKELYPTVTPPALDKISLVLPIADPELLKAMQQVVWMSVEDDEMPYKNTMTKGGYQTSVEVTLPTEQPTDNPPKLLIQGSSSKGHMRYEYNPSKMDKASYEHLDNYAECSSYADDWMQLIAPAKVTRVDINRDIIGVHIDSHLFRPKGTSASVCHIGNDGKLETLIFGKSCGNQSVIYDKIKEQKLDPEQHHPVTRVECRIKPQCSVMKLKEIAYPFQKVIIYRALLENEYGFGDVEKFFPWFYDACRLRGVPNAMKAVGMKNSIKYYDGILKQWAPAWWLLSSKWEQERDFMLKASRLYLE